MTAPIPITAFGETKSIRQWSLDDRCTVSSATLAARLKDGWDAEKSITAPRRTGGRQRTVVVSEGEVFAHLTVLREVEPRRINGRAARSVECRCQCGATVIVGLQHLRQGLVKSCGCHVPEARRQVAAAQMKYGAEPVASGPLARLHRIWRSMKYRCKPDTNHRMGHRYGRRGIRVCEQWQTFGPFRSWALANGYRDDLEIDRIDNDGNYEPDNCRWVTTLQNARNKPAHHSGPCTSKRQVMVEAFGERKNLLDWQRDPRSKVSRVTIKSRIGRGWTAEDAITTPDARMAS